MVLITISNEKGVKMKTINKSKISISIIIVTLVACIVALLFIYRTSNKNSNITTNIDTMMDLYNEIYPSFMVSTLSDYAQLDYDQLLFSAQTIALVEAADELTVDNSFGIGKSGDVFYNAYSIRNVDALRYYKNEKEFGKSFEVIQECVCLEDGSVVAKDSYYPMLKNNTYLLFLDDSNYYRYPIQISADNGAFNLTYLRLSMRLQLITEALYKLGLLILPTKDDTIVTSFIDSSLVMGTGYSDEEYDSFYNSKDWTSIELSTEYTYKDMVIQLKYLETDEGYLFRVGNLIYSNNPSKYYYSDN